MIRGTTVQVELRTEPTAPATTTTDGTASQMATRDALGNDIVAYATPVDVTDVLIQPGPCADLDAARPEGVTVAFTLHFPKTWAGGDLRGAQVTLPSPWAWGNPYRVVGKPEPWMAENCPTPWNMPVEVSATDG